MTWECIAITTGKAYFAFLTPRLARLIRFLVQKTKKHRRRISFHWINEAEKCSLERGISIEKYDVPPRMGIEPMTFRSILFSTFFYFC